MPIARPSLEPGAQAAALLALALGAGCSSQVSSPAVVIDSATPATVCASQLTTTITVRGAGFTPLPANTLAGAARIDLPRVLLTRRALLSGAAQVDAARQIPDAPVDGAPAPVRWRSGAQIDFDISPGLGAALAAGEGPDLPTGLYDVSVQNPDGRAATLAGALTVVPPPTLRGAAPAPVCSAQGDVTFTLTGAGFLKLGDELPQALFTLDSGGAQPVVVKALSAAGCSALPARAGAALATCTTLTVLAPRGALAAGSHRVAVRNPREAGCASPDGAAAPRVAVVPPPQVQEVRASTICTAQADSTVVLAGSDFLVLPDPNAPEDPKAAQHPRVTVGDRAFAAVASDCQPLADGQGAQRCATLTVTIPLGAVPPGSYPLAVQNPGGAACSTQMQLNLTAAPPPTVVEALPAALCAGGGTFALRGQDLRPGATVLLNGIAAASTTVAADGASAVATFTGVFTPGGPYQLTIRNPDSCQTTLARPVSIVPGPTVLFADPPALPSTLTVPVTLYVTGLTPPVSAVYLQPSGGGSARFLNFAFSAEHPSRLSATVPAGLDAGAYDILVRDSTDCPALLPGALKVVAAPTLTVSGISPAAGATGQGTAVTVSGAGFVATPRVYLSPSGAPVGTLGTGVSAVAFQSATALTGVVPAGAAAAAAYDVIVVNPDGSFGVASRAFRVTSANAPPPLITSLSPGSVVGGAAQTVVVNGQNFRSPRASLACQDAAGNAANGATATVTSSGGSSVTLSVNATGALCTVRVTNNDNTFFDYAALGVTGASLNLSGFTQGPSLQSARRALGAAAGRVTSAARFLYAVGGDNGAAASPMDSVEFASIAANGALGSFALQAQRLPGPRSFLEVVPVGRFLYAVGGYDGTKAVADVLRAELLSPQAAPQDLAVDIAYNGRTGLAAGPYIYRVAAVMRADDANNPGGEGLASDPFTLVIPASHAGKLQLALRWRKVSGAAGYRVYRSPLPNDAIGKERLLGEVGASDDPSIGDTGDGVPAGAAPLPLGSTGAWRRVASLRTARLGAGAAAVPDPGNGNVVYLYVAGGAGGTPAAPAPLSSVELITLTLDQDGNQSVAAPVLGPPLRSARWAVRAVPATAAHNSVFSANAPYLYVLSGSGADLATLVREIDYAPVGAGGQLAAFTSVAPSARRPAFAAALLNNQILTFGGLQGNAASDNADSATFSAATTLGNFNSQGGGNLKLPRALQGTAVESAFIYQIGGANAASDTAQATTEQAIW